MKKNRYFDRAEKKAAWLLDKAGRLLKQVELDWRNRSPVSGAWQVPAQMTIVEPNIEKKDGYIRIYKDGKWGYVDKDDDSKQPEIKPDTKQDEPTLAERISKLENNTEEQALSDRVAKLEKNASSGSGDYKIFISNDGKQSYIRFDNGFTIESGVVAFKPCNVRRKEKVNYGGGREISYLIDYGTTPLLQYKNTTLIMISGESDTTRVGNEIRAIGKDYVPSYLINPNANKTRGYVIIGIS